MTDLPQPEGAAPDRQVQRLKTRAGPLKRARRTMKRALTKSREAIVSRVPQSVRERFGPAGNYLRMLAGDHVGLRLLFKNRHKLAPDVWRSAQPLPHQIRALAAGGIGTIINLRGKTKTATYDLERTACAEHGITLIDFAMKSRAAPSKDTLLAARQLLANTKRPFLIHCKSGADRAGLLSAIYVHDALDVPMAEAKRQLSLRYGHIRQADTGILDYFLECYIAENAAHPIAFWDWVETRYDPLDLERTFKAKSWATRIVRSVLKRE